MRLTTLITLALAFLLSAGRSYSQIVPPPMSTLSGQRVTFPKVGSKKPLLLVLSFSSRSNTDLTSWNKHFKSPYANNSRIDYYELADFQGVPSFIMKMILHGMRRSVAEPEWSHLAPFLSDEDKWKKLSTSIVLKSVTSSWQTPKEMSSGRA